jgi:predicted O-methyltransferase YrrM
MEGGTFTDWVARVMEHPRLLLSGHAQRAEDQNLGLGWLYYSLGRILRPRRAVVIGSWRGFAPLMIGKALQDNVEPGEVIFIDPSLVDDFWKRPVDVNAYFSGLGVENIRHFCMTTQEFVESSDYESLGEIGIVFIDGHHTQEQARFDYESFKGLLAPRGLVLLHDSMVVRDDKVYGADKAYKMTVKYFVDQLKEDPSLQVFDLPFGASGLTLVRTLEGEASRSLHDWLGDPGLAKT